MNEKSTKKKKLKKSEENSESLTEMQIKVTVLKDNKTA